jgi:c-di-GMP-binding flagellar brake protein YcgR
MAATHERRRHSRHSVTHACKIYHRPSRQYLSAQTCDLSNGGVLIRVTSGRPLTVGDHVDIAVDWADRSLVTTDSMLRGRVVRIAGGIGRHQSVALEFQEAHELAAVA